MLLMLPFLFGLSRGNAPVPVAGLVEGSLSAASVPVADLVQALQVEMTSMKKTLQRENSELRLENEEIRKELSDMKNRISHLEQGQLANALEVRSCEDDIQRNKIDIIDLGINNDQQEVGIQETLTMISTINATGSAP